MSTPSPKRRKRAFRDFRPCPRKRVIEDWMLVSHEKSLEYRPAKSPSQETMPDTDINQVFAYESLYRSVIPLPIDVWQTIVPFLGLRRPASMWSIHKLLFIRLQRTAPTCVFNKSTLFLPSPSYGEIREDRMLGQSMHVSDRTSTVLCQRSYSSLPPGLLYSTNFSVINRYRCPIAQIFLQYALTMLSVAETDAVSFINEPSFYGGTVTITFGYPFNHEYEGAEFPVYLGIWVNVNFYVELSTRIPFGDYRVYTSLRPLKGMAVTHPNYWTTRVCHTVEGKLTQRQLLMLDEVH